MMQGGETERHIFFAEIVSPSFLPIVCHTHHKSEIFFYLATAIARSFSFGLSSDCIFVNLSFAFITNLNFH